jgi:hypothetical protein
MGGTMTYTPVKTDDGFEIRDENANTIWGPSETHSWPPNAEMMEAVFDDANISQPTKDVFRLLAGLSEIKDERSQS